MKVRQVVAAVVLLVVLVPAIAAPVFLLTFNPNNYAPDLIAAVARATGRQLTLGGPLRLGLSLTPTIEVSDAALANPAGFPDQNFLTLLQLQARIALLPLLRHRLDIIKLVLVSPNILLERNATGQGNWDFSAAHGATPPGTDHPSAAGLKIGLQAVEIQHGLLRLKNPAGAVTTLALADLTGTAASLTGPLTLQASAAYNGTPFTLAGTTGAIAAFTGATARSWPLNLTLAAAGGSATVQGEIAAPLLAKGYDVQVNILLPALQAAAPLLPSTLLAGITLPPLHNITAAARLVDQSSLIPAIDNLSIKIGPSDLSSLRPGLSLTALQLTMKSLDQPLALQASGAIGALPLALTVTLGAPQYLLNAAWLPASMPPFQGSFPVTANAQAGVGAGAGAATFGAAGGIATPTKLAGVALALTAAVPDLTTLSPLAGTSLPAWKNLALQTTLIDPGGLGLRQAAGLDSLTVTMDNAAFGGDASLYFNAHPSLKAALAAQTINADALLAAWPPAAPSAAAAKTTPATPSPYIIPDQPLPLALLKAADADIQLTANTVIYHNTSYNALQAHAVLTRGMLSISPFTAQLPGGSLTATAALDSTKTPATAALTVNAPALAMSPFLKTLGLPSAAQGTVQAAARLAGNGDSLHQLAASLNGEIGIASVNGVIDGTLLYQLFGGALSTVGLPASLAGAQGPVAMRCFALRIDAANGAGTVRAFTLASSRLLLQGGGGLNFGTEILALILRPQLQIAGNQLAVPVEIGGSFKNPRPMVAPLAALQGAAGSLTQNAAGGPSLLGQIISSLGLSGATDPCPAALSAARFGRPGPAPAAAAPAPAPTGTLAAPANQPKSLLNALFGK